ncbi:MFS transporter [Agromyces aerolatus]|uniref:MFS transporter n=1 Tax=Agromyces sp. LY-1074 TaxID=3074080 RepID=UPI002864E91F|nr:MULTISPECIES: MFS transporter [unclassified Agromyces]MDR5699425.1 MFS transporter [Agromyces sp. LY-1074]MDR5705721.1 MFS transporter [Agromyces sp. LY-1358]
MTDPLAASARPEPLWSRRYLLAIGVNFCIVVIFYLMITTMALYALEGFLADEFVAGVVSGAFVVGSVIARLVGGKFLDVAGRRRTLLVCLGACIALALAQSVVEHLWVLMVLQGLNGVVFGAASTAVTTGAFALIPATRRGEGAGYYGISTTLGSAVGPALGTALIGIAGFPSLFVASACSAAVALVGALFLRVPERGITDADRVALRNWSIWTFVERAALPAAALMFVAGVAFSGVLSFINPYSVNVTGAVVGGTYFAVYAAVVLVGRLFVGRIQDRLGDNAVVYPLLGCLAAGIGILVLGVEGWVVPVSAVLVGFGFGVLMPTMQSITVTLAGQGRVALATSTFFLALDLGVGLGPLVDGVLVALVGYPGMYAALSAVSLLGMAYYARVHGRHTRWNRPSALR